MNTSKNTDLIFVNESKIHPNYYIGPNFINRLGYGQLLAFSFYNPISKTQIINLRFFLWKIRSSYSNSIYIPFYTKGISHKLYKHNFLF